jgi:hypothetical protein
MKVRICSGNQKGAVVDMPQTEAESSISSGYAELYDPAKDQTVLDATNASERNAAKVSKKEASRLVEQSPSAKPATGAKKATARKK